jgi:uncharacterized protein YegP (UPF0339 family)
MYTDKAGKCRWRLKAANGETIATGEAFVIRNFMQKRNRLYKKERTNS